MLFDNPGDGVSPGEKDLLKLDCSVDTNPDLLLYRALAGSLDSIGRDMLVDTYLFCPLPAHSYHVTVWDGLNDGNAGDVLEHYRPGVKDYLAGLPRSLLADNAFTGLADDSPLGRENWTIRLKFDRLLKWGDRVLVARLAPADRDSERELKIIVDHRRDLSARFRERFKARTTVDYSPHVSLGYFANTQYAGLATPQISRWDDVVRRKVDGLTIAFTGISLYGFTDMATFFKRRGIAREDK